MTRRFKTFLNCRLLGSHNWTTPFIERGCKVNTALVTTAGLLQAFKHDTKMYCKDCGELSPANKIADKKTIKWKQTKKV